MIQVNLLSERSSSTELRVRAAMKEAAMYADDVAAAVRYFNSSLKEMGRPGGYMPSDQYRVLQVNNKFAEVWHYRPDGGQDYLVGSFEGEEEV